MTFRNTAIAATLGITLFLAGCSSGGTSDGVPPSQASPPTTTEPSGPRPRSVAKLAIVSPRNGQVIKGSTVNVRLSLKGAKVVAASTTDIRPDRGHIHLYLDGTLYSMTFGVDQTIHDVSPGQHVLRAEFVASDHAPFDPRVIVQTTFEVKP